MEKIKQTDVSPRRKFLQKLATGTAALGIASVLTPFQQAHAGLISTSNDSSPEEWFNQIKGKHKIVFDATGPHGIFPFAWPRVFLLTNASTGTPENENSVVVILRHNAIPYAFTDNMWAKYNFGEVFKIDDPKTKKPATRNPFWQPKPGDFSVPGIGNVNIGINELQESGVLFCVCSMAIMVNSTVVADKMNMKADDVKKDWLSNIIPGIEPMPSGVWAVGRAQEHGCGYCFVG